MDGIRRFMTSPPTDIHEPNDQTGSNSVLDMLRDGGDVAHANFFELHRADLRRFATSLMAPRLRQRLDESDIIQEGFLQFKREVASYLKTPRIPPAIWLRRIIRQTIWRANRDHLETQSRDPRREVAQSETSRAFVDEIAESISSVGNKATRNEMRVCIRDLVSLMPIQQREILWLIHVEACSLREAAEELQITYDAAKKRYQRALVRLTDQYGDELKELTQP